MKIILLAVTALFGVLQSAGAFSLAGPIANGGDSWQATEIGYGPPRDAVAPKNLGEEFRRNTPVLYYACDATFLGFFGSNGIVAIDDAFAVLNGLTNVSSYSPNLSEFPLESRHVNYEAQAKGLYDLKSFTLGLLVGQLGLADPVSYIWGIHGRYHVGSVGCPVGMEYLVVQRNFDFVSSQTSQLQYSPYVNDTLYSYDIVEVCSGSPILAEAVPFSVDPLADTYSPVASYIIDWGDYYTGLTRDDMAGLRYLMQSNNINNEVASPDSVVYTIATNATALQAFPDLNGTNSVFSTNGTAFYYFAGDTNQLVGYGDLAAFCAFARTNGPVALQLAYPGVVINSFSNDVIRITNETYSYTYAPSPYGSTYPPPNVLTLITNYTPGTQSIYYYQFANIFTNHLYTNKAYIYTTTVGAPVGSTYGSAVVTNYSVISTNLVGGDFFVLSHFYTNYCPVDIVGTLWTNTLVLTNMLSGGGTNNALVSTNVASGSTNTVNSTVYIVSYFTNYTYKIHPLTCAASTNTLGLYRGIERIQYVRADYDALFGQTFKPVTNNYDLVMRDNSSKDTVQHFQRIVTVPDYIMRAEDLASGPNAIPRVSIHSRNLNFNADNVLIDLAGPGTIYPPTIISFEKVGPVYYNSYSDVMDGTPYFDQTPGSSVVTNLFYGYYFVWANFDGTTNTPVVYPNGTSIDNLGNMAQVNITPATLPDGTAGKAYPGVDFIATGGAFSAPYTWTAVGLPSGMELTADGFLGGTPTQAGNFVFTLTRTDSLARSVQWNYLLTIQK